MFRVCQRRAYEASAPIDADECYISIVSRHKSPRAPQQTRSQQLVDALLEATTRVIRDVGWPRARVSRIAKVAGLSVGSLYRYFPGRDILLSAVIDRSLARDEQAFQDALASMQGPSVQDSVRNFIESLLRDTRLTNPQLLRHLVDVLETAARLQKVQHAFDELSRRFATQLLHVHPQLDETTVLRRSHMAFWGLRGAFIARLRVEEPFNQDLFQAEALNILGSLLHEHQRSPTKEPEQQANRHDVHRQRQAQIDKK